MFIIAELTGNVDCTRLTINYFMSFRHYTQRSSTNSGYSRGGSRPQGANSSAGSYFNSYDQRQMSRGGGAPGRGGRTIQNNYNLDSN